MQIESLANRVLAYMNAFPQVKNCRFYGSLANGSFDNYSDIDLEIDVSGLDNGQFLLEIPTLISQRFPVIFFDFAPSLAPEKYVVSVAIDTENPFGIVDISCAAQPHCRTVSKQDLVARNDSYCHILKLFAINLKHFIRRADCLGDIQRMYQKVFRTNDYIRNPQEMLADVYRWLKENASEKQEAYVRALEPYIKEAYPFDH